MPTPPLSTYCITLRALRPGHHNSRPPHPLGSLRRSHLLETCCPSPDVCFLEEDRPATTPVILSVVWARRRRAMADVPYAPSRD
ncbi:hypothetical protein E2C01_082330 [Portunus trituberculatus]|uniref:Uncharacterized protein n=1 Tax=Portunus trituberculatus TaxID=210409 RepID=A0A5B7J3J2_PORTR|nr:hypothetical protein [Portunus trituberculatus]